MIQRILIVGAVLLATPALAMEVQDIQGGCESTMARKLVRQASAKLERCGATGQVILHVSPEGRVEHISSDPDARGCLNARTADWRLKMKEANHCTLHLATQASVAQVHANVEASTHPHTPLGMTAAAPAKAAPPATVTQAPVAQKPGKLSKADKAAKRATLVAAKKAAKAAKLAQKKTAKAATIAARKAKGATARNARVEKAKAARAAKAEKTRQKREAAAARKAAKHQGLNAKKPAHKARKHHRD